MQKTLAILLCILGVEAVWAAPANPLVRPAALANRSGAAAGAPASGYPGNMPPPPPAPTYNSTLGGLQAGGEQGAAGRSGDTAQAQLARFSVVAIAGEQAVLRVVPEGAAAPAPTVAQGIPGLYPPASTSAAAPSTPRTGSSSLVVRHRQRVALGDQELVAEVAGGMVTLKTAELSKVVFVGSVEGSGQRAVRPVQLEPSDAAYVSRHSPPVGAAGTAALNSGSGGSSNSGAGR